MAVHLEQVVHGLLRQLDESKRRLLHEALTSGLGGSAIAAGEPPGCPLVEQGRIQLVGLESPIGGKEVVHQVVTAEPSNERARLVVHNITFIYPSAGTRIGRVVSCVHCFHHLKNDNVSVQQCITKGCIGQDTCARVIGCGQHHAVRAARRTSTHNHSFQSRHRSA